jgi:hypothetical protein
MKGFAKGDRVLHAQYGTGTLTEVNEYHTVIDFDAHGTRKFITNLVAIESTDVAAPARPGKPARKSARGGTRS